MTEEDIIKICECIVILNRFGYYLMLCYKNYNSVRDYGYINNYPIYNIGCKRLLEDLGSNEFEIVGTSGCLLKDKPIKFNSINELSNYVNKLEKLKVMI